MKKLNRKGFTLVELLAVIVILGIVMLIGVTAVGPLITDSRKKGLVSDASSLADASQTAILGSQMNNKNLNGTYCFTIQALVAKGFYTQKDKNLKGRVEVVISNGAVTKTTVWATKGNLKIAGKNTPIEDTAVEDGDGGSTYNTCTSGTKTDW